MKELRERTALPAAPGGRPRPTPKRLSLGLVGLLTSALVTASLWGCSRSHQASAKELAAVTYAPVPGRGWEVSTPAHEGLDPLLVAKTPKL